MAKKKMTDQKLIADPLKAAEAVFAEHLVLGKGPTADYLSARDLVTLSIAQSLAIIAKNMAPILSEPDEPVTRRI